jgi:FAD:protein FMN transferase
MGTIFTIDLYVADQATAEQDMDLAFDEIDRLEALLSNYRPSSELSRISREAGAAPVVTDPETFRFLERSLYWSRVSNGAFDITVGPLLRAWGFFFHQGRIPSQGELNAVRNKIGWKNIALDPQTRTVSFTNHQSMELDPGSIGKGFAVDSVVKLLRNQGVTSAFISAGGSTLYAIGAVPGTAGWPVDIPDPRPDPRHPGKIAATILLKDTSLSTGACTEKFFIKNGHRYCHIFDPRTMRPVEAMLQTTVIDPSATDSDALSTVVFVLGPEASRKLLASMPNTQALIFNQPPSPLSAPSCTAINWTGNPCEASPAAPKRIPSS